MMRVSPALSSGQLQDYHKSDYGNSLQEYYSAKEQGTPKGEWFGKLAEEWGLAGQPVTDEQFKRLTEGYHPVTNEPLVRLQSDGVHRAGWDMTFSAPKTVSITGIVGQDQSVTQAHREAVSTTLGELEKYTQAHLGGNKGVETTGKWIGVRFEHDTARPVDGYMAPQLHTHAVVFNVTTTNSGATRALETQELYRSQSFGRALYQSELAASLKNSGYSLERGENHAPEIKGYSKEYLAASSPRRQVIQEEMQERNLSGARAAERVATGTRERKSSEPRQITDEKHRQMDSEFGYQSKQVVTAAKEAKVERLSEVERSDVASHALTHARDRNFEREAVVGEREILRDALDRSKGNATWADVKDAFQERQRAGDFIQRDLGKRSSQKGFTTPSVLKSEREVITAMQKGQDQVLPMRESNNQSPPEWSHLRDQQREAVGQILSSRDRIIGFQGAAGTGKTTTLKAVQEYATKQGYEVQGLAPTGRASSELQKAGIESQTLQKYLVSQHDASDKQRLFFVDEASLASTKQMAGFLKTLQPNERVLFIGDTRQHQAVEAGKSFEQLQKAGMRTARVEEVLRQQDPELRSVVEKLYQGESAQAVKQLSAQSRIHEVADRGSRLQSIVSEYVKDPDKTLVISPDNQSRAELNQHIHRQLQSLGKVSSEEGVRSTLVSRNDLTGADRKWASNYELGDVVRYRNGSKNEGFKAGEYVRVEHVDHERNTLLVRRENGEKAEYNPERLYGVNVYREEARAFASGDRIMMTAPLNEQRVANRELGSVMRLEQDGTLRLKMESGREINLPPEAKAHVDYGYATTSYSSQSLGRERVIANMEAGRGENLINERTLYVIASRSKEDLQIYTDNSRNFAMAVQRDVSKTSGLHDRELQSTPIPAQDHNEQRGQWVGLER